jgi:hypothetical protein
MSYNVIKIRNLLHVEARNVSQLWTGRSGVGTRGRADDFSFFRKFRTSSESHFTSYTYAVSRGCYSLAVKRPVSEVGYSFYLC